MDEIEKAIENFKMENALLGVRNPMKVARNELAIVALREQQEREKGCEYCRDEKIVTSGLDHAGFYIAGNALTYSKQTAADDIFEDDAFVNFCPVCGRRLKEENDA